MYIFSPFNFSIMQKPLLPALFFGLLLFFGCGKSTDQPENVDRWFVSWFAQDQLGNDLTDDTELFKDYLFEFNTDNELNIIRPDGSTVAAKWGESNSTLFVIGVDNPEPPIEHINGNWDIESYTTTNIVLKRKVGVDASQIYNAELEFTKQ